MKAVAKAEERKKNSCFTLSVLLLVGKGSGGCVGVV